MPTSFSIPDLTGRIINDGQYQLIRKLGSGAYGVVYKAINLAFIFPPSSSKTSPRYAIKVLRKEGLSSSAAMRVRREVAAHRRMSDHPNVVSMHDAFEDRDYVYIVLDYCPGGDLFGKIADEKLYFRKDELVKSVFLQILDAVETCHRKLIYHRDLKPENILTTKDGSKVYLTDFGLTTGSQVSETFGCGSSYYMSPGQYHFISWVILVLTLIVECLGKEVGFMPYSNRANDIWALGIILINMLTCRSPWTKALTTDMCFRDFLLHGDYLREMLPISEGANTIFRQIFMYEPSERITIPALRKAILDLDTFFMTDDEIAHASGAAQIAASSCGVHIKAAEECAAVPAPAGYKATVQVATAALSKQQDLSTSSSSTNYNAFIVDDSSKESETSSVSDAGPSASESDGPVTPSTRPQAPTLVISEFNLKLSDFGGQSVEEAKNKAFTPRGLCIVNMEA
jgi:serine/threonine protein kinase